MIRSAWKRLLRGLGLAIALWFSIGTMAIAQPLPSAMTWIAQAPEEQPTANDRVQQGLPVPRADESNPSERAVSDQSAQNTQNRNQTAQPLQQEPSSGGPYDLKAIEESYRSLYGS